MSNMQMTVSQQRDIADRLSTAFPRELHPDVQAVLGILPIGQIDPSSYDIGLIRINSEYLHIPVRIYSDEPPRNSIDNLNLTQRLILSCLLTRHNDGYVRERYAIEILSSPEGWIPPYVIQLAGEYVVEILTLLESHVEKLDKGVYARFHSQNAVFVQQTRHRIISYWDCYYRSQWPNFADYPGYGFMNALGFWISKDALILLSR